LIYILISIVLISILCAWFIIRKIIIPAFNWVDKLFVDGNGDNYIDGNGSKYGGDK